MARGWFRLPGIRPDGDRSIEEQMLGLASAIGEAKDKTVLDLGCAEGAIGLAFAMAGAKRVLGIEALREHLDAARLLCNGVENIEFEQAYLQDWMAAHEPPERFDIVLALGIIHKLFDPGEILRWACRSCNDLLLFRAPAAAWQGNVTAKHSANGKPRVTVHVPTIMAEEGFRFEQKISGARGEAVEYWRRT